MPTSIIMPGRATLFRVGRRADFQGLWYDAAGQFHGDVHKLKDGPAASLPMGVDPIFRSEGKRWISTTASLETLRNWFSEADMRELLPLGYMVERIEVHEHRRFEFETYGHEACAAEHIRARCVIDEALLYPALARPS